jgi:hypothetical protein
MVEPAAKSGGFVLAFLRFLALRIEKHAVCSGCSCKISFAAILIDTN